MRTFTDYSSKKKGKDNGKIFSRQTGKKETHGRLTLPVRALTGDGSTTGGQRGNIPEEHPQTSGDGTASLMCREKPQPL